MELDLRADLNSEDDEGRNWALLDGARDPRLVRPGAVLRAGVLGFWSWVRIDAVDADGQVRFQQITAAEAHRASRATAAG